MGLGVWFSEDIAHVLQGVGEGVNLLVTHRGVRDATDAAYIAGYWAALRAVAVALGLGYPVGPALDGALCQVLEADRTEVQR